MADDPRAAQTRSDLLAAFRRLVHARPYDEIRVSEIADRAGVGRSTFYEHFRGKDELLRSSVRAVLGPLAGSLAPPGDAAGVAWFLDHVSENRSNTLAMLRGSASRIAADVLCDELTERGASGVGARYASEGVVGVLLEWLARPGSDGSGPVALALIRLSASAFSPG